MLPAPALFKFDFDDLRTPAARLTAVCGPALPASALEVPASGPRPRWLPSLLAVFPAASPLHVEVSGGGTFAGLVMESLAALLATAGGAARVRVVRVPGGLVVGSPALRGLPRRPQMTLVPADLTPAAVSAAQALAIGLPDPLLVLNGRLPWLDRKLGVDPELACLRLPLVGRQELEAIRRGLPAGLAGRRFGLGILELGQTIMARYAEAQP